MDNQKPKSKIFELILKFGAGGGGGTLMLFLMTVVFDKVFTSGIRPISWVIGSSAFVILLIVVFLSIKAAHTHYNDKHSTPQKCEDAIKNHCTKIDEIHCTFSSHCNKAISEMNTKIKEQAQHIEKVDALLSNATCLEEVFTKSVQKRLRNNAQLADMEERVKDGSKIFIMTSHFKLEIDYPKMRKAIIDNLNEGVKYRYIIPEGAEEAFKEMLYLLFLDDTLNPNFLKSVENDFFVAAIIPKKYVLLTIGYYEMKNDTEGTNVIFKLPAANTKEARDELEPLAYLVPPGQPNHEKQFSIHADILERLQLIYSQAGNGNYCKPTAQTLLSVFPAGLKVNNKKRILKIPD